MNAQSIIPPNIDYGKISADKYSPDDTYEAGELRIQYNSLWKAKQAISVPEPWTPDHWDPTTLAAEFSALNSRIAVTGERTNLISMSAPGAQNVDFTQYKKLRIAVSATNVYTNVMFLDTDVLSEANEYMWLYAGWFDTDNYSVIARFIISKSTFTLSELRTSQGATNPGISVIGIS